MDSLVNIRPEHLELAHWLLRIAVVVLIWFGGRWLSRMLIRLVNNVLGRLPLEKTLVKFAVEVVHVLFLLTLILIIFEILHIPTTPLLAILGASGLAVGLALKDSLGNIAAGILLIFLRPFRLGDWVQVANRDGEVEKIHFLFTQLRLSDNCYMYVPNGQIAASTIVNYSAQPTRRLGLVFGVGYEADLRQVKHLLDVVAREDDRVLQQPPPKAFVTELADSRINLTLQVWVATADWQAVRSNLLETVKLAFDEAGISIPLPQQEVLVRNVSVASTVGTNNETA